MTGEVIKSFMVGLGFDVDDKSLAKFNKAIDSSVKKVTALYISIQAAAAGIAYGISSISQSFEDMGYEYHLIAPAINKALLLRQEMLKAYQAAGVNIYKVIQSSVKLNFSLEKTKYAFKALYSGVASKFFPLLQKQSDLFRKKLYDNMPRIQAQLEKFVKAIFKASDALIQLGTRLWSILTRVYDFFAKLHQATHGWSTVILGVLAAWKLLNLSFLATPLGMLLAGFAALLLLWDDFKTFKEGGKSLIDWGSETVKVLVGLAAAVAAVALAFGAWSVISSIIGLVKAFNAALTITEAILAVIEAPFWAIAAAIGAIIAALTLADAKWQIFGGHLSGFFSGVGGKILDFAGGATAGALGAGGPAGRPLGNMQAGSQTNQHVNQQTSIYVNGAADAHSTGQAVAGQQTRVQRDSIDYLKGATK